MLWAYQGMSEHARDMQKLAWKAADILGRPMSELYPQFRRLAFVHRLPNIGSRIPPLEEGARALIQRLSPYLQPTPQARRMVETAVETYRLMKQRAAPGPQDRPTMAAPRAAEKPPPPEEPPLHPWLAGLTIPFPSWDAAIDVSLAKASDQLRRLGRFPRWLGEAWSSRPFDPKSLATLAREARLLETRASALKPVAPPDPKAFARAYQAWIAAGRDPLRLDKDRIKILCQHPETALDPDWVGSLVRAEGLALHRSWLESLLSAYLGHWRRMERPDALEHALIDLAGKAQACRRWAANLKEEISPVIGLDAPWKLLDGTQDPLKDWEALIERWCLSKTSGLGPAILDGAMRRWCKGWLLIGASKGLEPRLEGLRAGLELLTREPGISPTCFAATVSDLIVSESAARHPELREELIRFAILHPNLGDPRVKAHLWVSMATAKARLISWMAQKDLRLFYDFVVADESDDQGRKAFWVKYLPKVVDFRLVLAMDDRDRLEDRLAEHGVSFASMEGPNQVSAFILRFHSSRDQSDLVCVEFSKVGNSLYLFDAQVFEQEVARMDALTFRAGSQPRNLKDMYLCKVRFPHTSNWQWKVSEYLDSHGIHAR